MDPITILAPLALLIIGSAVGSGKIINEGNQALVERLGQFHRKLEPGLNFIIPFVDSIVVEETTRERVLDIEPQEAITRDNVSLIADAVLYWQIFDLKKAYYAIDDIENALKNLVLTRLRTEVGQMELEQTFSARKEINQAMLAELDDVTDAWGVKVTRVEVLDIMPVQTVLESMEQERAAEIKKRASILEAEGAAEYMNRISQALRSQANSKEVLQFYLAQRFVDANYRLGESPNSKILFMDPKAMSEALGELMGTETDVPNGSNGGNGNK
ncbi:paraslipin [Trichocoleus sp. FACHB-90]|uniref:SPFH domain-containing protein n=1 Tax=Cyanophyceae TaxID=3028117 RepID=UPI00168914D4|nr:stomatin-like protein [Trichocoleus sp. FACHB-90]MBD1928885.1 paraslipin [Trichocoleus sp. FACHB-90]